MRLNAVEKAPLLTRLGGRVEGERVLEIGCGRGVGTQIIVDTFGAGHVRAFDLDPDMIDRARQRLDIYGDRVSLSVGDAEHIDAPDESFDAVFDFGIIHHIPNWRAAVREVHRVLRPGGRFFFEEVTSHALARWSYRTFLEHPDNDRFGAFGFVHELESVGLHVGDRATTRFFGDFVTGAVE